MIGLALVLLPATLHSQTIPGALPESARALAQGEWPAYAGTYAAAPAVNACALPAKRASL